MLLDCQYKTLLKKFSCTDCLLNCSYDHMLPSCLSSSSFCSSYRLPLLQDPLFQLKGRHCLTNSCNSIFFEMHFELLNASIPTAFPVCHTSLLFPMFLLHTKCHFQALFCIYCIFVFKLHILDLYFLFCISFASIPVYSIVWLAPYKLLV